MSKAIILADGTFPFHQVPLDILNSAEAIICCDGSAAALDEFGLTPVAIVGDMDSINEVLRIKYADRLHPDAGQETNDLTKSVDWCVREGYDDLVIVGATGKREDHTIGNISLLAEYARMVKVKMVTDTGIFIPLLTGGDLETYPGQQISIFSIDPETEITSSGLLYPLVKRKLTNWWQGTLNEASGSSLRFDFTDGRIIVFLKY
jgi:thiamine pyrophosphokinase